MDESVQKIFYYIGIVAALFLFFYYILPLLVSIIGFVLKIMFYTFIWGAVAFVVIMLVAHVVKVVRKEI